MILHKVKVYPSKIHLPKKSQLAWKIAVIASDNARLDKNIYRAKPGITGLAQILGYDMSNPEELAVIDSIYLENESLKIKMLILLGTFFKYPRNYLANQFKIKNHKEDL